ncbi:hypothetical protein WN51_05613 [Melipona quadrifasciata]|uniref:Uncharacterized protein n=1 Tax=Melipona quadrifasciata TaxID=166423 RepID=A0A0M8ZR60_9HYME|nr:hypothetical protein WN51_05613 [Melipona quadrifasciata]
MAEYIKNCTVCQTNKLTRIRPREEGMITDTPKFPNDKVALDDDYDNNWITEMKKKLINDINSSLNIQNTSSNKQELEQSIDRNKNILEPTNTKEYVETLDIHLNNEKHDINCTYSLSSNISSIDGKFMYLTRVFPNADPPTYLTRDEKIKRIRIMEQQKQYIKKLIIKNFLEIYHELFKYFRNPERKSKYNSDAFEFLKSHFNKFEVSCIAQGTTRISCFMDCDGEFKFSIFQKVLSPTQFSIFIRKKQEIEVMVAGIENLGLSEISRKISASAAVSKRHTIFLAVVSSRPNNFNTTEKVASDVIQDQKESKIIGEKAVVDPVKTKRHIYGDLRRIKDKIISSAITIGMTKFETIKTIKLAILNLLSTKIEVLMNEIQNIDVLDLLDSPTIQFFMSILEKLTTKSSDDFLFPESRQGSNNNFDLLRKNVETDKNSTENFKLTSMKLV